jgi:PHD/YefM family antitoxin component YafN of YafNO toxin-antitoxin module
MNRLPPNYPRRTVRIAVEHLLRHPMAIADRAERDKVVILRAGKPHRVIMKHDYYRLLLRRAGQIDDESSRRRLPSRLVKREFRARRRPISN